MKFRPSSAKDTDHNPGPGAYSFDGSARPASKGGKFGTEKRSGLTQTDGANPGPGNYTVSGTLNGTHSIGFGTGKRTSINQSTNNPGPGNYSSYDKIKGAGPAVSSNFNICSIQWPRGKRIDSEIAILDLANIILM